MSELTPLQPFDEHNQVLAAQVHPGDWQNPKPAARYDLVVLGAGTAGLVTAAGAAGLGAKVALVEKALMGGDCLNVGCVPSKALLRAARAAAAVRDADKFGVRSGPPATIDFGTVMERMRRLRAKISPNDSAARFRNLGVDVFFGAARFQDDQTVQVDHPGGGTDLTFRKAVIATGARAAAPPIPGLDSVPYLTNEDLFSLTELPSRLGVIGGGPIGVEMAQAFARFGSQVTLFEMSDRILPREEPAAAEILTRALRHDGVELITGSRDQQISPGPGQTIRVQGQHGEGGYDCQVDQLLVAVGRAPNVEDLALDSVNVAFDRKGVTVDDHLRTTHPRIFAAGDVCSRFQFTHAADFQARIVIQNALFAVGPFGRRKQSQLVTPWVTYTAPEVAHVGLTEQEAVQQGIAIDTYTQSMEDVDRAILDEAPGYARVYVKRGTDQILGATIVADHAGDLISELTLAMTHQLGLGKIASTMHPYPTQADAIRKLGDQFNRTRLTPFSKWVLDRLRAWNT